VVRERDDGRVALPTYERGGGMSVEWALFWFFAGVVFGVAGCAITGWLAMREPL
jgi:hypothetical protein